MNNKNLLDELYSNNERSHFLYNQFYVEGLLYGACACPEIPLPDMWIPWTIETHRSVKDNQQADEVFTLLFDSFRQVLSRMRSNTLELPSYVQYVHGSENFSQEQFFKGLLASHQQLENTWQQAWSYMQKKDVDNAPQLAKELKHCLLMFSTFADIKAAAERAREAGNKEFTTKLPEIAASLRRAFAQYVKLSGVLVSFLPEQFETYSS